jgi:transposase
MMGKQPADEGKLFYYNFSLESRIPARHVLRRIQETLDFSFAYEEVQDCYGVNGNVSVPPPVILKLMLLLFLYDVASERELLETLPYRLDWLWFCGYDIDSPIPDHSVLSKARRRWGVTVFETLFARVVASCVRAGLVDGGKIHVDGSLVEANASKNSIVTGSAALIAPLREQLRSETMKLDEPWAETPEACGPTSAEPDDEVETSGRGPKQRQVSTTDAEAAVVCRGHLSSRARYKNHRVVDDRYGVITATETTPGDVEENARLMALVDQHEQHTGGSVKTVVADAQYGTAANFQACFGRGIASHMGDLRASQSQKGRWAGLFRREDFRYDAATDTYLCPAGQR